MRQLGLVFGDHAGLAQDVEQAPDRVEAVPNPAIIRNMEAAAGRSRHARRLDCRRGRDLLPRFEGERLALLHRLGDRGRQPQRLRVVAVGLERLDPGGRGGDVLVPPEAGDDRVAVGLLDDLVQGGVGPVEMQRVQGLVEDRP